MTQAYIVEFVISRVYDSEPKEGIGRKEVLEMATQDFWDDARHGNLTPKITIRKSRGR